MTRKSKNCWNPSRILAVLVSVTIVGCGGSKTQSVPATVPSVEESVDAIEHVEEKVEGAAESVAEPKAETEVKGATEVKGETIQDEPMIAGLTREDFRNQILTPSRAWTSCRATRQSNFPKKA